MLSIRMKRLGRKGHPTYRVVVQDSRQSPSSGKYVALLGSYDPHTKQSTLVKDKAEFYLKNGAQPSDRVISLFKSEKVSLPEWVKQPSKKEKSLRNPDKLRRNRPAGEEPKQKPEESESEQPAQEEAEAKVEESKSEESKQESTDKQEEPKAESEEQETASDDSKPEAEPESEEVAAEDKS